MTRISLIICVALLASVPDHAAAWRARNLHQVEPVASSLSATVFEVIGRAGSGAADYWCGAGDYVRHRLGRAAVQRVYIWRAIGPSVARPGRRAMQFSLTAPDNPSPSPGYSLSMKAVGDNLTASFAFQYCFDNDRRDSLFPWR